MPLYCIAINCNSNHRCAPKGTSFHCFPLKTLMPMLVANISQKNTSLNLSWRIWNKKLMLKDRAVPTLFSFSAPAKRRRKLSEWSWTLLNTIVENKLLPCLRNLSKAKPSTDMLVVGLISYWLLITLCYPEINQCLVTLIQSQYHW